MKYQYLRNRGPSIYKLMQPMLSPTLFWRNLSSSIRGAFLAELEADFLGRPFRRCHQLLNCRQEGANRLILGFHLAFQLGQPVGQGFMGRSYFPESNKSPDHKNTNLDSLRRIWNSGQQDRPRLMTPRAGSLGKRPNAGRRKPEALKNLDSGSRSACPG